MAAILSEGVVSSNAERREVEQISYCERTGTSILEPV
jgi:hypothetical protein